MIEFVTGRCTNSLFCSVAGNGELLRLPAGARFVCAHCGKGLVPVCERPRSALTTGLLFGLGMAATSGGLMALGALLGGNPAPAVLAPAEAASHPARHTPADAMAPAPVAVASAGLRPGGHR